MTQYRTGLLVCGLSFAGSTEATLFTDGQLSVATLPGTLSPLGASTQLAQRLVVGGISGLSCRVNDLRSPLITANTPEALMQDDTEGTLSALFSPDGGWLHTNRWTIQNKTRIEKADTTITLTGPVTPTVDQLVWLGPECLKITAVSSFALVHTCGVTRGQCGSRAMVHALDPEAYPEGDSGARQALTVYSRQVFDGDRKIEAALYRFRMADNDPHAVEAVEWVWYGYLAARPRQNTDFVWSVAVSHCSRAIEDATLKGGAELELSHCVLSFADPRGAGYETAGNALSIALFLTIYEFERLFNSPIHAGQAEEIETSLLTNLRSDLLLDPKIGWEFDAEVGGYRWIWKPVSFLTLTQEGYPQIVRVTCSTVARARGAATGDKPAVYPAIDGFTLHREQGFNGGFIGSLGNVSLAEYRVRTTQGESAPKVKLRLRIKPATWAEASLYLLLSHHGGGDNHATYDKIIGARGLGFNPDWVNIGSAPANPLTVDPGTQEWLEHHAVFSDKYDYGFHPGDKLGAWFRNEAALRCAIVAFVPETGKIMARVWARSSSPTAITPITDGGPVEPGDTLSEQKALFLERGIDPLTLGAKFRKPLQLEGARAVDTKDAPTIRIWKQGGAFTDMDLANGSLAMLERATFGVGLGTPRVFALPMVLSAGLQFADHVSWTDESIPTAIGRGVTSLRLFVLGFDPKMSDGKQTAYCLEDVLNQDDTNTASTSSVGSGLRIDGLISIDLTNRVAEIYVEGLSKEQGFRGDTSDAALWNTIKAASGHIKISTSNLHNPFGTGERRGPQEIYVKLTDLLYDSGLRKTYCKVAWVDSQTTSRAVDPAAVIRVGSYLQLPEQRPSTAMPQGLALDQVSAIGSVLVDRVIVSSAGRRPRFDGRRSLINSTP